MNLFLLAGEVFFLAFLFASKYSAVDGTYEIDERFRQLVIKYSKMTRNKNSGLKLRDFSWEDCGDSTFAARFKSISVSPDPIHLPGNITVSGKGTLSRSISSPILASVVLKKKIIVWVEVPCIEHSGSCTYGDICQLLHHLPCSSSSNNNDKYYYNNFNGDVGGNGSPNFSCQCPFAEGSYDIPPMTFAIFDPKIPSILLDGQFQVTVHLYDAIGEIACLHSHFTVE
ncbi:hypothetical protein HELRODRAFT_191068 [Helobdella robusta]|uniref:MD-2-related lipid-recognition domain-containing protein n=1 Tax=Helobdella robusta TaxID=6412 RepID=T1FSK1_HELRO|nr:hypothetical protein HELRODRAFT_191068 [Helobdella robusta]ESO07133.1 hypothetical protein HELRODRAFT_191068 [Helobdella robusta]